MADLPTGTVTFLFSDVEGSTRMLERHGSAAGAALARHHDIFEREVRGAGGVIFETVGDAVYAAFQRPTAAIRAAIAVHRALAAEDWGAVGPVRVRIAIHTGEVEARGRHYFGAVLFRSARLLAIGHGGQTLVSSVTAEMARDDLASEIALRPMGPHRLKDLGAVEHVFQADAHGLPTAFPPLRSLDSRPNNLPEQLTTFIGREAELRAINDLLDEARLVTLLGPGGAGKTRLALQAAADRIERHTDGVFLVELAPITDPELVLPAIASALTMAPDGTRPLVDVLVEFFGSRDVLLVMDNFEHLLGAARDVATLLTRTTGMHVLATSRAPLRVRGERELAVAPLATRPNGGRGPAVDLFIARASDVRSDLANPDAATVRAIEEICRRVDGLPLAIELAAARTRVFDPDELLHRLERRMAVLRGGPADAAERQRSLAATLDWSVNLLPPRDRNVLAVCSAFSGGWTTEAADAVVASDEPVLDSLVTLVENSLVVRASSPRGARFTMLETVREFASSLLDGPAADVVRQRHAEYYVALAERLDRDLFGPAGRDAREELGTEFPNIDAAFRWALERRHTDIALRLVWALRWAWDTVVGRHREALALSESALALADEPSLAHARALHATGNVAWLLNDGARAKGYYERALEMYREVDEAAGIASMLNNLATYAPEPDVQAKMYREAREIHGRRGDRHGEAQAAHNHGVVELARGRLEEARALMHEGVEIARAAGDEMHVSGGLLGMADIDIARGDLESATALIEEAATVAERADAQFMIMTARAFAARVAYRRGADAAATELLKETLATPGLADWRPSVVAYVADVLAPMLARRGDAPSAARVLGMADSFLLPNAMLISPLREAAVRDDMAPARDALGDEAFEAERAAGERIPAEEQEAELARRLDELEAILGAEAESGVRAR